MADSTRPVLGLSGDLQHYLQESRAALLRALDGASDYDVRRPMTPSGTNLLGLVKHLTGVESSYLGDCAGRPSQVRLPWVEDGSIWEGADMWASAEESRDHLVGLYRAAWEHSDVSIAELPLPSRAHVEWWPADRRETIDGTAGRDQDEMGDEVWWAGYVARIQAAADTYLP